MSMRAPKKKKQKKQSRLGLIVALLAVQVTVCMYTEKDWKKQVNCAIVLIPLILRALMIK